MAEIIGRQIGGFEILKEVGRGAMGVVFLARQVSMDRVVALKFLPKRLAKVERYVQRFKREAQAAGQLSHPNIVHVFDVGMAEGMYFLSMEYIDGCSAKSKLKRDGPFSEEAAVGLGKAIAGALKAAHSRGILHRDVKPDNFLIDKSGRVCLADLGLAKFEEGGPEEGHLTQAGSALGTPHYMSPEAARGEPLDARGDLYSLGASLYNLVTGKTPFEGRTAAVIMAKVLSDEPLPLRKRAPGLSPGFVAIVEKLMQREPAKRFQTAEELLKAFSRLVAPQSAETAKAAKTGRASRPVAPASRPPTTAALAPVPPKATVGRAARVRSAGGGEVQSQHILFVVLGGGLAIVLVSLLSLSGGVRRRSSAAERAPVPAPVAAIKDPVPPPRAGAGAPVQTAPRPVGVSGEGGLAERKDLPPSVPAAYHELLLKHEAQLRSDPEALAQEWDRFLKANSAAPEAREAARFMAEASVAFERQKEAWASVQSAIEEALRKDQPGAALSACNGYLQQHGLAAQAQEAQRRLEQLRGPGLEWARRQVQTAQESLAKGNRAEAEARQRELVQALPQDWWAQAGLPALQAALAAQPGPGQAQAAKTVEGGEAELQLLHDELVFRLRGRDFRGGFDFERLAEAYTAEAAKPNAAVAPAARRWADLFREAGQLWAEAQKGYANRKEQVVLKELAGFDQLKVLEWSATGLLGMATGGKGQQWIRWEQLRSEDALALAQWQVGEQAQAGEILRLGALALAVGACEEARELLKHASGLGEEARARAAEPMRLVELEIAQPQERKARAALARARGAKVAQNRQGARAALQPLLAGGEWAGTRVVGRYKGEIEELRAWCGGSQEGAVPEVVVADAAEWLKAQGWKVEGQWRQEGTRAGSFKVKDGSLRLDRLEVALELGLKLEAGAKVGVFVRQDEEAVKKFLNEMPFLTADRVKTYLERLDRYLAPGYGVRLEGLQADVFAPPTSLEQIFRWSQADGEVPGRGPGPGPGGRPGRRRWGGADGGGPFAQLQAQAQSLPSKKATWDLPQNQHKLVVFIGPDNGFGVILDGKQLLEKQNLRSRGQVVVEVSGEAVFEGFRFK